jgi:hypothetical protein
LEYENSQNKFDDRPNAIFDWKNIIKIYCTENDKTINMRKIQKQKIHGQKMLYRLHVVFNGGLYSLTVYQA